MRRRLVVLAVANTVMVALAFLVPLAVLVRTLARDRALNAAELEAQSLAPALALTQEPDSLRIAVAATDAGQQGRLTIVLPGGDQVGARAPRNSPNLALARQGRAFSADTDGGMEVLVPVALSGQATAVVRVFVPNALLERGVRSAWAAETLLGVALVVVAVVLADRMARSIVRPVRDLASAAGRLGEGNLDVRIEPEGPPEIQSAAVAFNRLGRRVGELLATERELLADLSHRLRTPLTALRLDAEGIGDEEDRRRIGDDVGELERAIDTMIRQARRPIRHEMGPLSDAAAVARDRLAFWAPLAEDQDRAATVDIAVESAPVPVAADELEAALDALLGNVFAHTPEGTPFRVTVSRLPGGRVSLSVEDSGPGLAEELVTRGASGAGSTGLGLDIVRRTAEGAGGYLTISRAPKGGARIELRLPSAGAASPNSSRPE